MEIEVGKKYLTRSCEIVKFTDEDIELDLTHPVGEWIDFDGNICPVPESVMVEVEFVDAAIEGATANAGAFGWVEGFYPNAIIKRYKIIDPSEAEKATEVAKPSPVRTVTKTEPVPGIYGAVEINDAGMVLMRPTDSLNEMREAAATLNEIVDVLEEGKE